MRLHQTMIDSYKLHGCAWALLQPSALSNKFCIRSVVRVGLPLVIYVVWFRSLQGVERTNAYEERHRGAVDFIAIKTVSGLYLTVSEKSQGQYTQQATKKCSTKSSCHVLHKLFVGTNWKSFFIIVDPTWLWNSAFEVSSNKVPVRYRPNAASSGWS